MISFKNADKIGMGQDSPANNHDVPDRSTFESAYAGQAPWDIGKPQKALLVVIGGLLIGLVVNWGTPASGSGRFASSPCGPGESAAEVIPGGKKVAAPPEVVSFPTQDGGLI